MEWTKEIPNREGYYWIYRPDLPPPLANNPPTIIWISIFTATVHGNYVGDERSIVLDETDGWFYMGPLDEPAVPKEEGLE
jgi:hypothetical protein